MERGGQVAAGGGIHLQGAAGRVNGIVGCRIAFFGVLDDFVLCAAGCRVDGRCHHFRRINHFLQVVQALDHFFNGSVGVNL